MTRPSARTNRFSFNGEEVTAEGVALPARIEKAIRQKHSLESSGHAPLWLIWLDRKDGMGLRINTVATSVDAARYGCFIVLEQGEVWCERIPSNHGFGSSIQPQLDEAKHDYARSYIQIHGYKRSGD